MVLLQDIVVTLLAIGAGYIIFKRVFAVVRPAAGKPGCANCPSAEAHGQATAATPADTAKPLTLVRNDRHG